MAAGIHMIKKQECAKTYFLPKTSVIRNTGSGIIRTNYNQITPLLEVIEHMSIKPIEIWGIDNENNK